MPAFENELVGLLKKIIKLFIKTVPKHSEDVTGFRGLLLKESKVLWLYSNCIR